MSSSSNSALLLSLFFTVLTVGCGGGSISQPPPNNPPLQMTAIAVTPNSVSLGVGGTQQLNVNATYNDGSQKDVTSSSTWTDSDQSIATISNTGLVTALVAGTATIQAKDGSLSSTSTVKVTPAPPPQMTAISVAPASVAMVVGGAQQLTVTATFDDGSQQDVTSTSTWTNSDQTVASVSSTGLVVALAPGTTTIQATNGSFTSPSVVTVTAVILPPPQVTSISVNPATISLAVSGTQQLSVSAIFSDGSQQDVTSTSTWTDSNPAVASVSSMGLVTALTAGTTTIQATNGSFTSSSTITVTAPVQMTSISVSPASASLAVGGTQQLTVNATYSDGSQKDVTSTSNWTDSNQSVASVSSTGLVTALNAGTTTIQATNGSFTSPSNITVTGGGNPPPPTVNIPTWHGNNQRTGLNAKETILTPSNVNPQTFGKLFSYSVDGYIYAQPLYISNLTINGSTHNVVFVATEKDNVYAFDADHPGDGTPLWKVSLLGTGELPVAPTSGNMRPFVGVTSTPVIDTASKTMYVVSVQDNGTKRFFRLHALDLTNGTEKLGGPVTISATVPGTNAESVNGMVTLPSNCLQRAALLLVNNAVIVGFGSCHSGWLLSYNAQNLSQMGIFNMSPNLDGFGTFPSAGGVWMSGAGPAADSANNVYVTTGNGPYDGITSYSDSAMKFDTSLHLLDHFTPFDYSFLGCKDTDLAAGGIMLIPGTTQALVGGKSGKIYMLNTASLGGSQANDAGATQSLFFEDDLSAHYLASCTDPQGNTFSSNITSYEIFATSAFFNGSVYLGVTPTAAVPAPVRQFNYANGQLTPAAFTPNSIFEGSYGTTPFISANGTASGIVWMIDHGVPIGSSATPTAAVLHAYDASNLTIELYNSAQNSADTAGFGMKFSSPIVANGKVFIGTAHDPTTTPNPTGELDVYGLKN